MEFSTCDIMLVLKKNMFKYGDISQFRIPNQGCLSRVSLIKSRFIFKLYFFKKKKLQSNKSHMKLTITKT